MLQQPKPDDFVIATGETHTVREFVELAFQAAGLTVTWKGKGLQEVGLVKGKVVVKINPKFYRPAEVELLLGNPAKAKKVLKWQPKVTFKKLIELMVKSDLKIQEESK